MRFYLSYVSLQTSGDSFGWRLGNPQLYSTPHSTPFYPYSNRNPVSSIPQGSVCLPQSDHVCVSQGMVQTTNTWGWLLCPVVRAPIPNMILQLSQILPALPTIPTTIVTPTTERSSSMFSSSLTFIGDKGGEFGENRFSVSTSL